MTGDHASRARPLRPADPQQLGPYRVTGRLGEGGMGTVYLAATADDAPVAVKVIRTDLVHEPEFRRRFRSEVDRARQVPPFCTAEVLDADPDHDPPYLVVEYVDGPSLAAMVEERGPLRPANLHGLAIGVATALTAIHGAGIIHRDLKPTNVLLAPGSPKVIDFGIARAVHAASVHNTANGQLVGTIAYMAPERFGQSAGEELTAAADIFAWGAIVAYAGMGRTPHGGDSPEVMAVRILTQPPDLSGLPGPLRDLVERALAKSPAERPSARELLDCLLTTGPLGTGEIAAALAHQPALLRAAEEAQAATDQSPLGDLPTATVGVRPASPTVEPEAETDAAIAPVPPSRAGRSRGRRAVLAVLALAMVLIAGAVGGVMSGVLPRPSAFGPPPPQDDPATVQAPPVPGLTGELVPPGAAPAITDSLRSENLWEDHTDKKHKTTCSFEDGLVVTKDTPGTYRCPGPTTDFSDASIAVDVSLLTPGTCAGMWFRFRPWEGYALQVCRDSFRLVTHGAGGTNAVVPLKNFPLAKPIPLRTPTRVGVALQGTALRIYQDNEQIGAWQDETFDGGYVALGIFQENTGNEPPHSVSFSDIKVWRPRA